MGRKKRFGGGHTIHRAEELFKQSVADGKPDYRYVALAIGSAPASPPSWAVWACIELRQEEERQAARGHAKNVSDVLDDIVRFFEQKERELERHPQNSSHAHTDYSPPSLRSAILHVLKGNEPQSGNAGSANDDWFRDIREAWDWEQKHDLAPSSFMQLDGFNTTSRIDRVLMQSMAAELGDPEDASTWVWITKKIIEQGGKE